MQIYIAEGTQQTGPFDLETIKAGLRAGKYAPTQLAWYEGAAGWEPLTKLPGLEGVVAPPPPPPAAAFPPPTPSAPPPFPAPPSGPYGGLQNYNAPAGPGMPGSYYPSVAPRKARLAPWLAILVAILGLAAMYGGIRQIIQAARPSSSSASTSSSSPGSGTPPRGPTQNAVVSSSQSSGAFSQVTRPSPAASRSAGSFWSDGPANGTRHFASNRAHYTSGDRKTHYVGFSFDYPSDWVLSEESPGNFVQVEHMVNLRNGRQAASESLVVSYAYSRPDYPLATNLDVVGPQLLSMVAAPLMTQSPQTTASSARSSRFGRYAAKEQQITAYFAEYQVSNYYRIWIVAQPNQSTDGLSVVMFGSDLAGTGSSDRLGESGGLKTIRDSFRLEP